MWFAMRTVSGRGRSGPFDGQAANNEMQGTVALLAFSCSLMVFSLGQLPLISRVGAALRAAPTGRRITMRLWPGAQRPANNRMQRTEACANKFAPASAADAAARSAE
jgi:hypothetical protein